MLEVKRKPNESIETMFQRFSELLKREKILDQVKAKKFYQKSKTKFQRKKEALARLANRKRKTHLRKIGILK